MFSILYINACSVYDTERYELSIFKTTASAGQADLKKMGADLADARKRRRISTITMAQRAMISRTTLVKVEKGDPGVSIGVVATVMFVLGMTDRLADIADSSHGPMLAHFSGAGRTQPSAST